ncbi:MAG: DNA methyltransferase [Actinobacteria bacterium]|nr:DNA methyltransferase [Actinomycetota bacterium]
MGSKYRLLPHLSSVFEEVGGGRALDAFSGSGVVSYLLKAQGFEVTSNDFLDFPAAITSATVVNQTELLTHEDVRAIVGPAADDRDFISRTFDGLYFNAEDRAFLDSAWSHIDRLGGAKRHIAIAALVLSAARKQPRGVFTFTDSTRYADGRRDLTLTLREHFVERVAEYNATVFDDGQTHRALVGDIADLPPSDFDLVYLDPPYAPQSDDADYMKRYHFLQGLAVYWEGQEIMTTTKTKKIIKKYTPFAYKRTIVDALARTFEQFADAGALVMSYSSNAVPDAATIVSLLRHVKATVEVHPIDHTYTFGTHAAATRRAVSEYLFVAR